jgi:hypothetical protein
MTRSNNAQRLKRKRRSAEYDRRAALVRRGRVLKFRQSQLAIPVPHPYDTVWDRATPHRLIEDSSGHRDTGTLPAQR